MNNQNAKKGGHFFNGFLWGAVIGGGFAYLVSTKRGRDILKDLMDEGLNVLDDLTREPEMAEDELSPITDEEEVKEPINEPVQLQQVEADAEESEKTEKHEPQSKKRFFRVKKK